MGLTSKSTGLGAFDNGLSIEKSNKNDLIIALAGNPNVGKSTIFNGLTGLNQHTGNWPGKTVSCAQGRCEFNDQGYIFVDLPGTYSLMAHSAEEEVARDFICFGGADATVVVCDATCIERNLNLVLQTIEITNKTVVAVNLLDEAKRKHINIDLSALEHELGVPVVGMSARSGNGFENLIKQIDSVISSPPKSPILPKYLEPIETAAEKISAALEDVDLKNLNRRWTALRLLESNSKLLDSIDSYLNLRLCENENLKAALSTLTVLPDLTDKITSCLVLNCESICCDVLSCEACGAARRDRKLDKILMGRKTGVPIMLILLSFVLWLTISGANYPSQMLSNALFWFQGKLTDLFAYLNSPWWLTGMLIDGVYKTLAWVVAVMLPPMAIFFPLFTLLEDFGYLPRVAFNLDHWFKKSNACGKGALTMCMGFGCNAAGVVGCRIIDSPRERLIAIITNSFVPCNGRFPTLILLSTLFFSGFVREVFQPVAATLMLTAFILFGISMTFAVSKLLSKTLLKGIPSSFALELPPYRRPQIGKVLVRSLLDRTIFVLGRAAAVAAPAGLILWLMANVTVGGESLLTICSQFLNPFACLLGLDGVILIAFILGFPANEIVVPIMIMGYTAAGSLTELNDTLAIKTLFADNNWSWVTVLCTMVFCLFHWPCSTTCLTIGKETKSLKWTVVSLLLPTLTGMVFCFALNLFAKLIFAV